MNNIIFNLGLSFIIGIIFGAGYFYAKSNIKLENLENNFCKNEQKIDMILQEIKNLSERISKLEGILKNGK